VSSDVSSIPSSPTTTAVWRKILRTGEARQKAWQARGARAYITGVWGCPPPARSMGQSPGQDWSSPLKLKAY